MEKQCLGGCRRHTGITKIEIINSEPGMGRAQELPNYLNYHHGGKEKKRRANTIKPDGDEA
jgi:hypothetical protein